MKTMVEGFFNMSTLKVYSLGAASWFITLANIHDIASIIAVVMTTIYTAIKAISEYKKIFKKNEDSDREE